MIVLLAIVATLLVLPVLDFARRSDLRRVALRNALRRPGEAALVILGSALGTAIIAAAFIVGDTFDYSIRDIARTRLGPIDQVVLLPLGNDLERATAALRADLPEGVDGVLPTRTIRAAIANGDPAQVDATDLFVEPNGRLHAFDLDQARAFGTDAAITGLADAGPTPDVDEMVINDALAADLQLEVGDTVVVFAYDQQQVFTVRTIVPAVGIAGRIDAIVAPGVLVAMAKDSATGTTPPNGAIYVSNDGGVFDSTDDAATVRRIEAATGDLLRAESIIHDQRPIKADLLEDAEAEGDEITEIFVVVGGFSVLAGIVLLVNLFVMLAEERKPTLGVLRAVGWKRNTLVRSFALEGAIYALFATVLGVFAGIGVGWAVVLATQNIFRGANSNFEILLDVVPSRLMVAGLIGLAISLISIWLTSLRISRLNIILAIRDLPEAPNARSRAFSIVAGVLAVAGGAALLFVGLQTDTTLAAFAGPAIALGGVALIAKPFVDGDALSLVAGIAVVLWGSFALQLLPDRLGEDVEVNLFLVMGVVLVAGGVALVSVLGPLAYRLVQRLPGNLTAQQIGLAYPVARRFRTAASLAMFGLVIFSLTFIAVLIGIFGNEANLLAAEQSAGRDIFIISNSTNPLPSDDLERIDGVESATSIVRAFPRQSGSWVPADESGSFGDPEVGSLSGIGADFAITGVPTLAERLPRFANDRAVFAAIAEDPTITVVPSWWLLPNNGLEVTLGDTLTVHTPTEDTHTLTVVGIVADDYVYAGAWMQNQLALDLLPDQATPNRFYVKVANGVAPQSVARDINANFLTNGADATPIRDEIEQFVSRQTGFFNLLAGYLSLGLVIGIAGLAVVLVRAVRERRREIGMLRAMGMRASGIRSIFVTEAAFVALLGIVTGVVLGLVTGYQVLANSAAFDGANRSFEIPGWPLAGIVVLPLVASALAAFLPAVRAGRMDPCEALRLSD